MRSKQYCNPNLITPEWLAEKVSVADIPTVTVANASDIIQESVKILLCVRGIIRQSDFPDYMDFVLFTPNFQIITFFKGVYPNTAAGDGKFVPDKNALAFAFPASDIDAYELINTVLPNLFWSAYQCALNSIKHAPIEMLAQTHLQDKWKTLRSWSNVSEFYEFKKAIDAGDLRIIEDFQTLLSKDEKHSLLTDEKVRLQQYQAAVVDYNPRIYSYTITAGQKYSVEEMFALAQAGEIQVVVGLDRQPLHNVEFTQEGDNIVAKGFFAQHHDDKTNSLIADTFYRARNIEREDNEHRLAAEFQSIRKSYPDIADNYIARQPAVVNLTFYPERHQYHARRHASLSEFIFEKKQPEIIIWNDPADPAAQTPLILTSETQDLLDRHELCNKSSLASNPACLWAPSVNHTQSSLRLPDKIVPVFNSHRR